MTKLPLLAINCCQSSEKKYSYNLITTREDKLRIMCKAMDAYYFWLHLGDDTRFEIADQFDSSIIIFCDSIV